MILNDTFDRKDGPRPGVVEQLGETLAKHRQREVTVLLIGHRGEGSWRDS